MRPVSARFLPIAGLCALVVLAGTSRLYAQAPQTLRVVPLVKESQVLVSFELVNGLTDEVRAAIQSGLTTTFTYTVELRMDVPAWVDRTIGTATIASSVEYDNLKRQYMMGLRIDGRSEEHTSELQSQSNLVCRLLLEKKKKKKKKNKTKKNITNKIQIN